MNLFEITQGKFSFQVQCCYFSYVCTCGYMYAWDMYPTHARMNAISICNIKHRNKQFLHCMHNWKYQEIYNKIKPVSRSLFPVPAACERVSFTCPNNNLNKNSFCLIHLMPPRWSSYILIQMSSLCSAIMTKTTPKNLHFEARRNFARSHKVTMYKGKQFAYLSYH